MDRRRMFFLLLTAMRLRRQKENIRRKMTRLHLTTFQIIRSRMRRLQTAVFLSFLTCLQETRGSWTFQRAETRFTDMWTNRHDMIYQNNFKADFRINLSTLIVLGCINGDSLK